MRCQSGGKWHQNRVRRYCMSVSLVVLPFVFCTILWYWIPGLRVTSPRKKHLWILILCSTLTQICKFSAACLKISLLKKKKKKIGLSVTENAATDGCFSVGCTLFIYSWGALKRTTLRPLAISHQVWPFVKKIKRYLTAWPHILI